MPAACPKCAHPTPDGNPVACANCGVVFAKIAAANHAILQANAKPRRRFGALHIILLTAIAVVAGIIAMALHQQAPTTRVDQPGQKAAIADRKQASEAGSETQRALNEMTAMLRKWDDASTLAGMTPRAGLATQISALQGIRRDMQAMVVPPCADESKSLAVESMQTAINGYMLFMASTRDEYEAKALIHKSATLMQQSNEAGEACNKTY